VGDAAVSSSNSVDAVGGTVRQSPNSTLDRTGGSPSLAAASQRGRSPHDNAMMVYPRSR
jgi:hypothetical protein